MYDLCGVCGQHSARAMYHPLRYHQHHHHYIHNRLAYLPSSQHRIVLPSSSKRLPKRGRNTRLSAPSHTYRQKLRLSSSASSNCGMHIKLPHSRFTDSNVHPLSRRVSPVSAVDRHYAYRPVSTEPKDVGTFEARSSSHGATAASCDLVRVTYR